MADAAVGTPSLACGGCGEGYNRWRRCPRLLPCGHTLCTPCLDTIIKEGSRRCPNCHTHILALSPFLVQKDTHVLKVLEESTKESYTARPKLRISSSLDPTTRFSKDFQDFADEKRQLKSYKTISKLDLNLSSDSSKDYSDLKLVTKSEKFQELKPKLKSSLSLDPETNLKKGSPDIGLETKPDKSQTNLKSLSIDPTRYLKKDSMDFEQQESLTKSYTTSPEHVKEILPESYTIKPKDNPSLHPTSFSKDLDNDKGYAEKSYSSLDSSSWLSKDVKSPAGSTLESFKPNINSRMFTDSNSSVSKDVKSPIESPIKSYNSSSLKSRKSFEIGGLVTRIEGCVSTPSASPPPIPAAPPPSLEICDLLDSASGQARSRDGSGGSDSRVTKRYSLDEVNWKSEKVVKEGSSGSDSGSNSYSVDKVTGNYNGKSTGECSGGSRGRESGRESVFGLDNVKIKSMDSITENSTEASNISSGSGSNSRSTSNTTTTTITPSTHTPNTTTTTTSYSFPNIRTKLNRTQIERTPTTQTSKKLSKSLSSPFPPLSSSSAGNDNPSRTHTYTSPFLKTSTSLRSLTLKTPTSLSRKEEGRDSSEVDLEAKSSHVQDSTTKIHSRSLSMEEKRASSEVNLETRSLSRKGQVVVPSEVNLELDTKVIDKREWKLDSSSLSRNREKIGDSEVNLEMNTSTSDLPDSISKLKLQPSSLSRTRRTGDDSEVDLEIGQGTNTQRSSSKLDSKSLWRKESNTSLEGRLKPHSTFDNAGETDGRLGRCDEGEGVTRGRVKSTQTSTPSHVLKMCRSITSKTRHTSTNSEEKTQENTSDTSTVPDSDAIVPPTPEKQTDKMDSSSGGKMSSSSPSSSSSHSNQSSNNKQESNADSSSSVQDQSATTKDGHNGLETDTDGFRDASGTYLTDPITSQLPDSQDFKDNLSEMKRRSDGDAGGLEMKDAEIKGQTRNARMSAWLKTLSTARYEDNTKRQSQNKTFNTKTTSSDDKKMHHRGPHTHSAQKDESKSENTKDLYAYSQTEYQEQMNEQDILNSETNTDSNAKLIPQKYTEIPKNQIKNDSRGSYNSRTNLGLKTQTFDSSTKEVKSLGTIEDINTKSDPQKQNHKLRGTKYETSDNTSLRIHNPTNFKTEKNIINSETPKQSNTKSDPQNTRGTKSNTSLRIHKPMNSKTEETSTNSGNPVEEFIQDQNTRLRSRLQGVSSMRGNEKTNKNTIPKTNLQFLLSRLEREGSAKTVTARMNLQDEDEDDDDVFESSSEERDEDGMSDVSSSYEEDDQDAKQDKIKTIVISNSNLRESKTTDIQEETKDSVKFQKVGVRGSNSETRLKQKNEMINSNTMKMKLGDETRVEESVKFQKGEVRGSNIETRLKQKNEMINSNTMKMKLGDETRVEDPLTSLDEDQKYPLDIDETDSVTKYKIGETDNLKPHDITFGLTNRIKDYRGRMRDEFTDADSTDAPQEYQPGVGVCSSHNMMLNLYCQDCQEWVCEDCLSILHKPAPVGSCRVITALEGVKEMKVSMEQFLSKKTNILDRFKEELVRIIQECDKGVSRHSQNVTSLQKRVLEERRMLRSVESMKDLAKDKLRQVEYWEDVLRRNLSLIDESSTSQDVITAVKDSSSDILQRAMEAVSLEASGGVLLSSSKKD